MTDTLAKLEELSKDETKSEFGENLEAPIISTLLDHPEFCEVDFLQPKFFSRLEHQYVIANILNYYAEHDVIPTRDILWDIISRSITEDDPWEEIQGIIYRPANPREIPHVKKVIRKWIRQQAYQRLYSNDAIEAFHMGEYQMIDDIVTQAAHV